MAKYETVAIADIHVPERLRAVRDDYAGVFALLINRGRELPPVKLRRTPNGKQKLELVAGAHRLRGYELAGRDAIDAQIVKADAKAARAEEIEENLYRYELTALERAAFVAEYRRLFEEEFGEIKRGGNTFVSDAKGSIRQLGGLMGNSAKLAELNLAGLVEDSQEGLFYARAMDRLGLSRRTAERLCTIDRNLQPALRTALTGGPWEDNQAAIERLSKLEPTLQVGIARAITEQGMAPDEAEQAMLARPKVSAQQKVWSRLTDTWGRADVARKRQFVTENAGDLADMLMGDTDSARALVATHRETIELLLAETH